MSTTFLRTSWIACLFLLIASIGLYGQTEQTEAEEKAEASESGFEIEGYGEILYQHYDYGPDRRSGADGAPEDSRSIVDIPRAVFEMKYFFDDDLRLEAEIEFEHGGTGSAMELEYEEFGEYEHEVEKGGEVVLEELHLTKRFSDHFSLRAGRLILPVGLTNKEHEPDDYFTATRPEGEMSIIPVTWNEIGLQGFGAVGDLEWMLMVVNGLDATGFTSENWIVEGHQTRFETIRATDPAVVARLDYSPLSWMTIGASFYRGNSTGNRPKEDMEGISGVVMIAEGDLRINRGPLVIRGEFLNGTLTNAPEISSKNSRISKNLQVPRTPVASAARAWSVEGGYDVFSLIDADSPIRLLPFIRYEYYNSMEETEGTTFADPRFERTLLTGGINLHPIKGLVLKADYSHRKLGLDRYNDENTFSIGVGYVGTFLEH